MENHTSDKKCIAGIIQNSLCNDCVFWYQCRQGKVDCQVNAARSAKRAVSA